MQYQVLIIGGGPAGISALLWCHSLGLRALMVEQAPALGGQMLQMYHPVLEYPGFPDKTGQALRDEFVSHLQTYALEWRLNATVTEFDAAQKKLIVNGELLQADAIICATGARNRALGIPQEASLYGQGLSQSATHDSARYAGAAVCVVGGGDSAFEDALIMAELCPQVTLLHRSAHFRARQSWQEAVLRHPRIRVETNAQITAMQKLADGTLSVEWQKQGAAQLPALQVGGVFVRLGIQPNTDWLGGQLALDEAGYIVTDKQQQTSQPDIYAAGDVCRPLCLSVATAIGHGAIAAKAIAENLRRRNCH